MSFLFADTRSGITPGMGIVPNSDSRWHFPSQIYNIIVDYEGKLLKLFPDYDDYLLSCLSNIAIQSSLPAFILWLEKIFILFDFFQFFSLLWNSSQPYPWPYLFVIYTRWINYLNLDFFSMTKNGALAGGTANESISKWGQMSDYIYYAAFYALGSLIISFGVWYFSSESNAYGKRPFLYRTYYYAFFIIIGYLAYLPCSLAIFRLYACGTNDRLYYPETKYVLDADPQTLCLSSEHLIFLFLCTVAHLPMLVGLPIIGYNIISNFSIYRNANDHEKKLQIQEIYYMLSLDTKWIDNQIWLFSSFHREHRFLPIVMLILKLLMVINYTFLRFDILVQSFIFVVIWGIVIFIVFFRNFIFPFRSASSNLMFFAFVSVIFVNSIFGCLDTFNVYNAVMVSSTQSLILLFVNASFFAVAIFIVIYEFWQPVINWPSVRTLYRIYHTPNLLQKVSSWIEIIRDIQSHKIGFLTDSLETMDLPRLEKSILCLRDAWLQAKIHGSIFESPINDLLEELLLIHSNRSFIALRKKLHWDKAYKNIIRETDEMSEVPSNQLKHQFNSLPPSAWNLTDTMPSNLALAPSASQLLQRRGKSNVISIQTNSTSTSYGLSSKTNQNLPVFLARKDRYFLMNPTKRRILIKLLAYRFFTQKHYDPRGKFNLVRGQEFLKMLQDAETKRKSKKSKRKSKDSNKSSKKLSFMQLLQRVTNPDANDDESVAASEKAKLINGEQDDGEEDNDDEEENEIPDQEESKRFTPLMIDEARIMIKKLQERTELALNKHSSAAKTIYEQQKLQLINTNRGSLSGMGTGSLARMSSPNLLSPTSPSMGLSRPPSQAQLMKAHSSSMFPGLQKITTMELLRETVDPDEQKDLEELFFLWDEAIQLYEMEEFPGDYEKLNIEAENWYAYRGLVSQRLEIVVNFLAEQQAIINEIGAEEVIEEGDDDDEEAAKNHPQIASQDILGTFPKDNPKTVHEGYDEDDDDYGDNDDDGTIDDIESQRLVSARSGPYSPLLKPKPAESPKLSKLSKFK